MRTATIRTIGILLVWILLAGALCLPAAAAAEDTTAFYYTAKYRNQFTKENLDAICADYNFKSGKFWCVKENVLQNFKGIDTRGKTRGGDDSGDNAKAAKGYYGCVWPGEYANEGNYNDWVHYHTDCDGFTKFIGYLLTGVVNFREEPELWDRYDGTEQKCAIDAAGGLKPGDMIESDTHVAVVYTVSSTQVTVMECWGSRNNQIAVGGGFNGRSTNLPISQLRTIINVVFRAKANSGSGGKTEPDPVPAAVTVSLRSGSTWAGNASRNNGYPTGKLQKGKNFGLRGIVEASETITSVTGTVLDLNRNGENALAPAVARPNSKTLDIRYSAINNNLQFEKLGNGAYAYTVTVVTSSGYSKTVLSSLFTVGSGTLPESYRIDPALLGDTVLIDDGSGVREIRTTDLPGIVKKTIPGDVNDDGTVDGRDAVHLMKYLAEEPDIEINRDNSDVNLDGTVDELDLKRLVENLAGKA